MRSPLDTHSLHSSSARHFTRQLLEVKDIIERRTEYLRSLQAEMADDSFYAQTEKSRAEIGEALAHLTWAAGALESAREQLP